MKHPLVTLALVLLATACGEHSFLATQPSRPASPDSANGSQDPNKDLGPDGIEGTDDDGLRRDIEGGVPGGHFDLDTSLMNYPFNQGKTDHHVHEYDDKFKTNGVDFFDMIDDKFTAVPQVDGSKTFYIIVGNATLSPGAKIVVNGKSYSAADWVKQQMQTKFSISGSNGTKLTALKVTFDAKTDISKQLVGTETKLVVSNTADANGAYRNGALTLQFLDVDKVELDNKLGVAALPSTGLVWEATLFHHIEAAGK